MASMTTELTTVVTIVVLGALMMVPVVGLTLRYTVPPILEAFARTRRTAPGARPAEGSATRPAAVADAVGAARPAASTVPALRRAPDAVPAGRGVAEGAVAVSL